MKAKRKAGGGLINVAPSTESEGLMMDMFREFSFGIRDANPTSETYNPFAIYRNDPVAFVQDVLGESVTDEIKELMLSVRDHRKTIGKSANAVGKTHAAARMVLWYYLCYTDAKIYTFAAPPIDNLETILWGEIGGLVIRHPTLLAGSKVSLASMHIERHPESFITGLAIPQSVDDAQKQARFSGKHAPHLMFVGDEADGVPNPIYKGIESCVSGGHTRILLLFNPRAAMGPVYEMESNKTANVISLKALTHPNVVTGLDVYPGAVTRETTVKRINEWSVPLPAGKIPDSECFEVPDYLVDSIAISDRGDVYPPLPAGWRRVTNNDMFVMVLAEYPAQPANQLISRVWIEDARIRWDTYAMTYGGNPPSGILPVMGQDVAELGDDDSVSILKYGSWVAPPYSWGGVDPLVTGDQAVRVYKANNVLWCNVDSSGVGASVAPYMIRKGCKAHRIMVQSGPNYEDLTEKERQKAEEDGLFERVRDQGWWGLREWLRTDPNAMLPPDDELVQDLMTPTYTKSKSGKIKVMDKDMMKEKLGGRSPDKGDALMLIFCPKPKKKASKVREGSYL